MALGREMHHGARAVRGEQPVERGAVADIRLREDMAGIPFQRGQRLAVAGIAQLVHVENGIRARIVQPVEDEVGADEAGAAGDKNV